MYVMILISSFTLEKIFYLKFIVNQSLVPKDRLTTEKHNINFN